MLLCARVICFRDLLAFPTYDAYIENFMAAVRLHCSHLTKTRACATAPVRTTGTVPAGPAPPATPAPHATPAELLALPTQHARAASAASIAIAAARDAASLPLAPLPFGPLLLLALLLPAPLLLHARLPLEPHAGAAPWSDKGAAMAPRRKLAEKTCSSRRSVNASSCSPGGTALTEGVEPPLPGGAQSAWLGFAAPQDDRPQRADMPANQLALGARARLLYNNKYIVNQRAG